MQAIIPGQTTQKDADRGDEELSLDAGDGVLEIFGEPLAAVGLAALM